MKMRLVKLAILAGLVTALSGTVLAADQQRDRDRDQLKEQDKSPLRDQDRLRDRDSVGAELMTPAERQQNASSISKSCAT